MQKPPKTAIVTTVLSAVVWIVAGCESTQRIATSVAAQPIGSVEHQGVKLPVFDGRKVRLDRTAPPVYPPAARQKGIQGVGVVRVVVDTTGKATAYAVIASSPTAEFGQAALAAARRWKYYPMTGEDGRPLVYAVELQVRFAAEPERPRFLDGAGWNGL